ncbi:haloacid dehalogenase [Niastella koreensis]|uniref:HAD-superfamily hydrolase, subfamily IA, variant 3 n=2 Tax=Niastella koreensis TaxID=354356 RepID=G8TH39_NIAKG|nr:HAD family phosphatase [Niastella koreensis]AEW00650.1 HAD-superfamily hydrolase, subfamily IA, variant 3 [Niastella koreensis GR20-10]OQP42282.1 haloacid dehalogenase [Niastella koreensis]
MDKAFLFDLNGTMIDDMQFHLRAWYHILNDDLGANLGWDETKSHMYGKNSELLIRIFGEDRFTTEEMDHLSLEKEKRYQQEYKPHLQLIPGLQQFLEKAYAMGIPMAIGSAAIMFNIDFVLDNLNIRKYFKTIVSADDVTISKPHPETYLKCAQLLGVEAANCLVFEDAPKGVEAAKNAGMAAVVLTTMHEQEEFAVYNNIIRYTKDYTQLSPADLVW